MQICCALLLLLCCLPQEQDSAKELYSDDFVRGMARRNVDADIAAGNAKGMQAHPILDVVPAGQTKSVKEIFAALNLDPKRMHLLEAEAMHNVFFLHWALSPSYTLSIMTDGRSYGEVAAKKTELLEMQGYGVRVFAADR